MRLSPLIEHLERHLGTMDHAWGESGEKDGIRVARFPGRPYDGVTTYATLGVSKNPLPMSGDRTVRQELVFFGNDEYPGEQIASFLVTFGEYVCGKAQALLRGDVVGPGPSLIPDARCQANSVYAAIPVLYDDGFATLNATDPATVFVWLVPLRPEEAEFVRREGWESFEDRLERAEVDFGDLQRSSVA